MARFQSSTTLNITIDVPVQSNLGFVFILKFFFYCISLSLSRRSSIQDSINYAYLSFHAIQTKFSCHLYSTSVVKVGMKCNIIQMILYFYWVPYIDDVEDALYLQSPAIILRLSRGPSSCHATDSAGNERGQGTRPW